MKIVILLLVSMVGVLAAPSEKTHIKTYSEATDRSLVGDIRPKRAASPYALPYSAYKPRISMNRYRYPLNKKRSDPSDGNSYDDYFEDEVPQKFSSFRERHFTPNFRKKSTYNLTPYDLKTIERLYELSKRYNEDDDSPVDEGVYFESPVSLNGMQARAHKYSSGYMQQPPIIRRKKRGAEDPHSSTSPNTKIVPLKKNSTVSKFQKPSKQINQNRDVIIHPEADRSKRAFGDLFSWNDHVAPNGDRNSREDFLTREYFKSIARSVGNKKKRTVYTSNQDLEFLDTIIAKLSDPVEIKQLEENLGATEKQLLAKINEDQRKGVVSKLHEDVAHMEDFKNMEKNIHQIINLIKVNTRTKTPTKKAGKPQPKAMTNENIHHMLNTDQLSKIDQSLKEEQDAFRVKLEEDKSSGRSQMFPEKFLKNAAESDNIEKMRTYVKMVMALSNKMNKTPLSHQLKGPNHHEKSKRKAVIEDSVLPFVAEALKLPEECPVLDHILSNCAIVSDTVGDVERAFFNPCLRHEICFMCGANVGVVGHECNAILSSALEATCTTSSLDCLSAAGQTYDILSKSNRYNSDGTCTYDPCVRDFLESL